MNHSNSTAKTQAQVEQGPADVKQDVTRSESPLVSGNAIANEQVEYSDEVISALKLHMTSGIGPRTFADLIEVFGSPQQVLTAVPSDLRNVPGVGSKLVAEIASAEKIDVQSQLDLCHQHKIEILARSSFDYPQLLNEIYDPPNILFCAGQLEPVDDVAVAIVGTRHATQYGKKVAESLSRSLAMAGVTIVSGLARGIDGIAHRAALDAGGRTIAVLGGGLLNVYPPEHGDLAEAIKQQGAVLSEALPMMAPKSGCFPRRNRIVSGMSLGVVVIEAGAKSGALISARLASEQGREVFAVPGRIDSRMSQGCHRLLQDGAKLVQNVDDILDELGPLIEPASIDGNATIRKPAELMLTDQESRILNTIGVQPTNFDDVVAVTDLPAARVLATVSVLEMRRLIRRVSGTTFVRV